MRWDELVKGIVEEAGAIGLNRSEQALAHIKKQTDEPWKKAVMGMLADAVEKHGWEGVELVKDAVDRISRGKAPDMSFASLKARSDALAMMQNMEADEKSRMKDFFSVVGESFGVILKAVIRGLLK